MFLGVGDETEKGLELVQERGELSVEGGGGKQDRRRGKETERVELLVGGSGGDEGNRDRDGDGGRGCRVINGAG